MVACLRQFGVRNNDGEGWDQWVRLHDLRPLSATLLGAAGVELKTISERLGHQDPAFTARIYQSVLPRQHQEAAAAIGAAIREARKGA